MDALKVLYYYVKTKQLQKKLRTKEDVLKHQKKEMQKFISNVLSQSPFYYERLQEQHMDWRKLSPIDKTIMMDEFDRLNTVGIKKEEAYRIAIQAEEERNFTPKIDGITVGLSSGTSGNRGIFLVSDQERLKWAGTILAKTLPNGILATEKIAFFLRANSNLYNTVKSRRIQFDFYDLIENPVDHIKRLNDQQPTLLVAPPAMLRLLAQYLNEGTLKIKPKKVISVADVLEPLDEIKIQKAFKTTIHQIYQCTEGFLASTCKYGTLHLNEDVILIEKEYVDKQEGKFIPIITDFSRSTQPIVRYRLNDILIEKKEVCLCGSAYTALEKIEGRSDDVFYLESCIQRNKYEVIFPDFIRRVFISSSDSILDYSVKQTTTDSLVVSLNIDGDNRNKNENEIRLKLGNLFKSYHCKIPHITFAPYEPKELDKKLRRIERLCKIDGIDIR